ncbi:MAG: NADH-quinone oxidoreductase subunit L [Candidatus Promineifilaceae bacterium]
MTVLFVVSVIVCPWIGALLVWLAGDGRPRVQHTVAVISAAAAALSALALIPQTTTEAVIAIDTRSILGLLTFVPDGLGVFLAAVAAVIGSLTIVFSVDYMRGEAQLGRYYALVLLFIGAMAGLVLSGSLLFLFIFWEITAFCSYALIAFDNDNPRAVAGGLKALVVTQLGGVGLLLGVMTIHAYLGDYQIGTFLAGAATLPTGILAFTGFAFLIAAAAKSAQVPLHIWLPDAMEAPTPVSALIHAATMVNAGVYLLARFYPAFSGVADWKMAVLLLGLLSAFLASIMALVATDLKRVLAYSTISQLGYMVSAIGLGAIFASQFHLLGHAIFKALLFLAAGAVIHAVGTRDMRRMGGLGRQMPLVAAVFIIGAAALAGLPPLVGFWSKESILEASFADGPLWAYLGLLITAGITALYSIRMVWLVFLGQPRETHYVHDAPTAMQAALIPLALGVLVIWLFAGRFGTWLAASLPFHTLHTPTTTALITDLWQHPTTWLALVVVGLGLAAWLWRSRLTSVSDRFQWIARSAEAGFGFDWIGQQVNRLTQWTAAVLQGTQTGQLNWNATGMVVGLIIFLLILAGSG